MPHIMFFSYARENLDPYLKDFFNDLCVEIATYTKWAPDDENISFRDQNNLRLMENWKSHIEVALQTSTVLVSIASVAYFNKEFCGKEYFLFDQKRRQGLPLNADPPPLILPVIWAPVDLPDYMNEPQQVPKGVADSYRTKGLRFLKRFDRNSYDLCVSAFAEAIVNAWRRYPKVKPLAKVTDFRDIPNKFASGDWQEAANSAGWLPGADVANFVFAAGSNEEMPDPDGRYGATPSQWRPYLPPDPTSILDYARKAAKSQKFRFREIPVNEKLGLELKGARERKNLTMMLVDPKALPVGIVQPGILDDHWWEGTALVFPCDDVAVKWEDPVVRAAFHTAFPRISQLQEPTVQGPVRSPKDLQLTLEKMLSDLLASVTQTEAGKKEKTDEPPPGVTAVPE